MTEIQDYLTGLVGAPESWEKLPWSAAQPALHVVGLAPQPAETHRSGGAVEPADAMALASAMLAMLRLENGEWAWSSALLDSIVSAGELAEGGPPELLLKAVDNALVRGPVTKNNYELCRALNGQLLARYGSDASFDLAWLTETPSSPAHACLRYWLLALRPGLLSDEVEERLMVLLRDSGFVF